MLVIKYISEIIPNRLYFATTNRPGVPFSVPKFVYISFDDNLVYPQIVSYYGPPNLATIFRYFNFLNNLLSNSPNNQIIIQCTSMTNAKRRTNSAFLIGLYAVMFLGFSPYNAIQAIRGGKQLKYLQFCDTTNQSASPTLDMVSFFRGFQRGIYERFCDLSNFDVLEYERLAYMYGYMHWILPNKFLAFPGPIQTRHDTGCGLYIEYFKMSNIDAVIRLNMPLYDANIFIDEGFKHYDLYFPDGTAPPLEILKSFLAIAESTRSLAIHCKAGYGRTGTLIAAYIIKHYNFTALEAVAWVRLCRPGSIIGIQQVFLESQENWLKSQGKLLKQFQDKLQNTAVINSR